MRSNERENILLETDREWNCQLFKTWFRERNFSQVTFLPGTTEFLTSKDLKLKAIIHPFIKSILTQADTLQMC